ncbi:M48 family metallopeptidase [Aeribacillus alveayuensis]|jgi:STE24 endopeptidase|uniref:Zn-dependent protease with chaperone function n=1 Tax=Aeribacillus alveayuensis TaxID=279215 RepID=A0ABT9VN00_9BACI|nr:Zn-dependent protease with chaperone function [Bacillus alveayuensis]
MRKRLTTAVIVYFIYGVFIYLYLYFLTDNTIPSNYEGTAVDPKTFMNARELMLSEEYSKIKNLLFFIGIPLEWFIFFLVLTIGLSKKFQQWAQSASKLPVVQMALYFFWLSLLVTILTWPFDWLSYKISSDYQITTQPFNGWIRDQVMDFFINYVLMLIIVAVIYSLMRKFEKRWWFFAWLLSIPFTLFLMFLQPVVIDPLYNDFYPLKDKILEEKILDLAEQANIPADHVYEVDMSKKTNALNAYVTGIGPNSRIVLWDTTLTKLEEDEILFIMAHEMGHYVMKHIYVGIFGYVLLSFVGLYLIHRFMNIIVQRWGNELKVTNVRDLSSLPLFLMLLGMLSFAASPLTNTVSRVQEKKADLYAIELTENEEAAVETFQDLAKYGLSEVNPPSLVKFFRYDHPTLLERMLYLKEE